MDIRDRIVEFRRIPAQELQVNANNWRVHPQAQRDLFAALMREVGIVGALLVYESERQGGLTLIDGHMRQAEYPEQAWPCLLTDLTDAEADDILLTYDPLSLLAQVNGSAHQAVLSNRESNDPILQQFFEDQRRRYGAIQPQSLDDLEATYGEPDPIDFWPLITVRVSPEVYAQYQTVLAKMPGADTPARFAALVATAAVAKGGAGV